MSDVKIKVYSTPRCMQCKITKKVLDKYGVEYESIELKSGEERPEEVKAFQSAPVVVVTNKDDGEIISSWSGFSESRIKSLTNLVSG